MFNRQQSQSISTGNIPAAISFLILAVVGASACSSIGHNVASEITVPRTVRHAQSLDSRVAPHYHQFVSILESNGFEVGQTDDHRALQLRVEIVRNPSALELIASLWQDETELINARGAANGAMAGSSHFRVLTQRAAVSFEQKLVELRPNLVIVEDSPPSASTD
jgi:hypothetical protein